MSADVDTDTDEGCCGRCGGPLAGAGFSAEVEYPPDDETDPGRFALQLCGDCADAIACSVLIDRSLMRGVGLYEDVLEGRTRGADR